MDFEEKIYQLKQEKKTFSVATIVETSGSIPAKIASKMVIMENGDVFGTVGGGEIERVVIQTGLKMLKHDHNKTVTFDLSSDAADSEKKLDMACGGKVSIFFESVVPKAELFIFGGGHISQALQKIVDKDKFKIIIVDNRKEFASAEIHRDADEIFCKDYDEYTKKFAPSSNSYIVIVTHGHKLDYEVLKNIYQRQLNIKYVGMIGSKSKIAETLVRLEREVGKVSLQNLFSPVGLQLGGSSPHEIAISIAAEMQSVMYNKNNIHLKLNYEKI